MLKLRLKLQNLVLSGYSDINEMKCQPMHYNLKMYRDNEIKQSQLLFLKHYID